MIRVKIFWFIGIFEIVIMMYSFFWVMGIRKFRYDWRRHFEKVPYAMFLLFWFGLFLYGYLIFFEESQQSQMFAKSLWEDILLSFMTPAAGTSIFLYFTINMMNQAEDNYNKKEKEKEEKKKKEESKKKR